MKHYQAIVVGSGCGAIIVDEVVGHGLKTAFIDRGPLIGGTCLNWGCIPSKMLIAAADRLVEMEEARKLGIAAQITGIDFKAVMNRMRRSRREEQQHLREGIGQGKPPDFYEGKARFVADYTLEVNGQKLKGERIFIASGSRPLIPPIRGLDGVDYLTNESVLELKERPESLVIIGGGYIAVEFGHFFAAMGTRVTILEMADRLVLSEEPEIAELLRQKLQKRMMVRTGMQVGEVKQSRKGVTVVATEKKTGKPRRFTAQHVLVAVGRRSNADILQVEKAGVALDGKGFIQTNESLETNVKNIYAVGDANGKQMFTHLANREATIVAYNVLHGEKMPVDYANVPHAVYSHPPIASVGLGEAEARKNHDVLVGKTFYRETARGEAIMETDGFAKVIVEKESGKLLGVHIIGPEAPELIQEAVNAMTSGGGIDEINRGIHIHPSLSELVPTLVNSVGE